MVTSLSYGADGAVGGTAGVRRHGLDSRRHPRGIHSRRGTQPCAAAWRRRLHGGRRRRDDGPDRVARSVRARPPSGRPERPRARRGRRSRLDGNPAPTQRPAHTSSAPGAPPAGRPHSTSGCTSSSTSTTKPWKTSAESTWCSTSSAAPTSRSCPWGAGRAGGTLARHRPAGGVARGRPGDRLRRDVRSGPNSSQRSPSGSGTVGCGRTSAPPRPSTTLLPLSTRPSGSRERRSSAFVRKDAETGDPRHV